MLPQSTQGRLEKDEAKNKSEMYYFAYGSNMDSAQLKKRVGLVPLGTKAYLDGHKIIFNKTSIRDSYGRANISESVNSKIEGVIFELTENQFDSLDKWEPGYKRISVKVEEDGSSVIIDAITYVALPAYIDNRLYPSAKYLEPILRGATDYGLSPEYVERAILSALTEAPVRAYR